MFKNVLPTLQMFTWAYHDAIKLAWFFLVIKFVAIFCPCGSGEELNYHPFPWSLFNTASVLLAESGTHSWADLLLIVNFLNSEN